MIYQIRSQLTGRTNKMDLPVTPEQIREWQTSRTLIQNAFPQLTPDQREFLLTGSTPEEWDSIFGGDDK